MHNILLLRISAILPEAISDGGLTPTTDTDLLLATYRGGSHFTSDIITDQIYTALVAKNICTQAEIIILRILPFFPYLDEHYCLRAAGRLLSLPKGCILLTTGFYVAGHAETDGPPETVALAYTLQKAGFTPVKKADMHPDPPGSISAFDHSYDIQPISFDRIFSRQSRSPLARPRIRGLCCRNIRRDRDIILVTAPGDRQDICRIRAGLQRIVKENDHIHTVPLDHIHKLLIPTYAAGEKLINLQIRYFFNSSAGNPCRI